MIGNHLTSRDSYRLKCLSDAGAIAIPQKKATLATQLLYHGQT